MYVYIKKIMLKRKSLDKHGSCNTIRAHYIRKFLRITDFQAIECSLSYVNDAETLEY